MLSYIPKLYLVQAFSLFKIQQQQNKLNLQYLQFKSMLFQSWNVFSFWGMGWCDSLHLGLHFNIENIKPTLWLKQPISSWENSLMEGVLSSFLFTEWKQLRKKQKKIVYWYWEQGRLIWGMGQEAVICGNIRNSLSLTHWHTHTHTHYLTSYRYNQDMDFL